MKNVGLCRRFLLLSFILVFTVIAIIIQVLSGFLELLIANAWLLKDFYDLIESLVNKIGHYKPDESGKYMYEESIGGNYSGTNFKILIID